MPPPRSNETPACGVTVSCLSQRSSEPPYWSLAVFAHNESGRIRAALERIVAAAGGVDIEVWVLANGCTDATCEEVRACAEVVPNLWLAEIPLADKANAWNLYVHELIAPDRAAQVDTYFFTDGDVTLERDALMLLAATLHTVPDVRAAGGMPATGRDKTAWRRRMVANGTLAGNLYALRAGFIDSIRRKRVRIPIGLIGEDLFVSWLVHTNLGTTAGPVAHPACAFCPRAEFSFRSMSPWRLRDYRRYLRRKWRYTLRALQLEMLMHVLRSGGLALMPGHVDELYRTAPLPSRLRWDGIDTPMRFLAVLNIRRFRARAPRTHHPQSG